jgi:HAUS augmin-like complex subunit 1
MDNLTAADLFSPSKALQQRALTQDWLQIESWLSAKYPGRPIPSFERNEATLKALRELCIANERADEDRAVRIRLQSAALAELDNAAVSRLLLYRMRFLQKQKARG